MDPRSTTTSRAGYATRDVAKILGLSRAQIYGYVHSGLLSPRRGSRREFRFSLADVVLLRTAKDLVQRVPARRVRRALRRLRAELPIGRPLSGLQIRVVGDELVVRDGSHLWKADSGQGVLNFEVAELASRVTPLARRAVEAARQTPRAVTAEDWYEMGCDLELGDPEQARDAYRRALELEPQHAGARLNLGRLLHEAGHAKAAEEHYRLALVAEPDNAIAAFNLGVALEDLGLEGDAIRAYEKAVALDDTTADAHYNLYRLYERAGQKPAALRHFNTYRRLIRSRR